jgi:RNA polymerase sigma-70 factor, ECF subfamily
VLRIIGRRDIAEDALQGCFVSVWQRAADYDPMRGGAMGWLITIVRHCAIDRLRRLGSHPEGHMAPEELLLELAGMDRADRGVEFRALQRCLDELDERPRRAVLLAYLYGLTRDELAVHLGVPIGTIKSWIRHSLDRLKKCLDG